jgi:hypothetical protein
VCSSQGGRLLLMKQHVRGLNHTPVRVTARQSDGVHPLRRGFYFRATGQARMPWLFIDGSPDTSTRRGDCEELPRWVSEVGPSSWGILI